MELTTPILPETLKTLKSGDVVYISGIIYTGRDAAHKKLVELIDQGKPFPIDLTNQVIYYVGPSPTKPGDVVGSAGPTSSYRMDPYSIALMPKGLRVMIGKGPRGDAFKDALVKEGAVYLSAVGGAAALIAKTITKSEVVAYEELGPEAIHAFHVTRFPAIVTYDTFGNDLFEAGIEAYKQV